MTRLRQWFFSLALVIVLCFATSYGYAGYFNNVKGWNDSSPTTMTDASVSSIDVDGEVGHLFSIQGMTAACMPSHNWWWSSMNITSGTLPPGMKMDDKGVISGIPTERGHWIVDIGVSGIACADAGPLPGYWQNFRQEIRFHIKGTGKVIE